MIVDLIENWQKYPLGKAWEKAFKFLTSLDCNVKEGEYLIDGQDVFARVMSYPTRPPDDAVLEAHRSYIDIQASLIGAEGIAWFPVSGLEAIQDYDSESDVCFYRHPNNGPARIDVHPGTFVVLFPWDAHMPQLEVVNTDKEVKKIVVKIRKELLVCQV